MREKYAMDETHGSFDEPRKNGFYLSREKAAFAVAIVIIAIAGVAIIVYFSTTRTEQSISCDQNDQNNYTTITPSTEHNDGRLPRDIKPMRYSVELFPDIYGDNPETFTFTGHVRIIIKCISKTNTIILNINKIDIIDGTILIGSNNEALESPNFQRHEIDTKWQFLKIYLDGDLTPSNDYTLEMNFTGPLKSDFAGFYLSTFRLKDTNRYVAATQFSPTDARKAFPCFDEPGRKARFDITLVRREPLISLSNMPLLRSESRKDGLVADVFETTPVMSTYILAFVVGDFGHAELQARPGLTFKAWVDNDKINKTATALKIGAEVLSFFETYFNSSFPLPKQDTLGVPETAVGAMENWGLIIYHEDRIFYSKEENPASSLVASADTISHEIAHQWFGNLVTMSWWSDLMLKEGFAMYFADVGTNIVYPEWNILDQFPLRKMYAVFDDDSLTSSHPIYLPLADTTHIRQVFDSISYDKGGCLIRMLNFILGDDMFRKGLKKYLDDNKFKSVGHDDLWYALGNQTVLDNYPMDIKGIMDTWVYQMNYPVITVTQSASGQLKLRQDRFLNSPQQAGNEKDTSPFGYTWKIPVTYTSSNAPSFNNTFMDILWMDHKELAIVDKRLPNTGDNASWAILNLQQGGYYRVNYELTIWDNLVKQLISDHEIIHVVNRGQLINDAWSLAKASLLSLTIPLHMLEYLNKETQYIPWEEAARQINYLDVFLQETDVYDKYKIFIKDQLRSYYLDLTSRNESLSTNEQLTWAVLSTLACKYGMNECVQKAKASFDRWSLDTQNYWLEPNTRSVVYCTAVKEGGEKEWETVFEAYKNTTTINKKISLLSAMACSENETLIKRYIDYTMNASVIQRQDAIDALTYIARSAVGRRLSWQHVATNWEFFMQEYAGSLFSLDYLVEGITKSFSTDEQLKQLEDFLSLSMDLGPANQAFQQAKEKTTTNSAWIKDNYHTIAEWLNSL